MREPGVAISLRLLGVSTAALPFGALVFCLLWSLCRDFEKATYTHCEQPELLPSISSVIGATPQAHVWNVSIALVSAPLLLFAWMYHRYFTERLQPLAPTTRRLLALNLALNLTETLSLLGLSFVPSSDIFELHEAFFVAFVVTSLLSMLLTVFHLYRNCGFKVQTSTESRSLLWKQRLVRATLAAAGLGLYFYWRHNAYCEAYVYSCFGLCEYVIVLSNMAYHGLVALDFAAATVRTGPDLVMVK